MSIDNRKRKIAKLGTEGELLLFKEIEKLDKKVPDIDGILDSVRGRQGEKGEKGDPGLDGFSIKGDKGDSIKGDKGDKGDFVKGEKGDKGEPGKTPVVNYDKVDAHIGRQIKGMKEALRDDLRVTLPDFDKIIDSKIIAPSDTLMGLSDTPKDYKEGHLLIQRGGKFEHLSLNNLPFQNNRNGGGTAEILVNGSKVVSSHRLNFVSGATITGDNGTANITISGGGGDTSPLTTKGDLYTYDTDNQRLAIGTDGQFLVADSGEATGMKWDTLATGDTPIATYRSEAGQSADSTSDVQIQWDTEDLEDDTYTHDTVTNNSRIQVGETARYLVTGSINYTGTTSNYRLTSEVSVSIDGGAVSSQKFRGGYVRASTGAEENQIAFSFILDLTSGSYFEINSKRLSSTSGDGTVDSGTTLNVVQLKGVKGDKGDAGSGGGADELSDLTDVNTSTPTNRNALLADGVDWESRPIVEADISDLGTYQDVLAEGAFVDGDKTKLDGIETSADVTDATNVNAAGAVMESDFTPAFSLMVQQSGTGSPETLQVGTDTIVGRVTGGGSEIDDLSPTQVRSLLNVEDGADVTDETNVVSSLDGATLSAVTVAATDKVIVQDASDSDNIKTVTAQSIADLGSGGGGSSSFAKAYLGTQMSSVTNTPTKVTLDTESWDTDGDFNTTNNDYTAPSDGKYFVVARVGCSSFTTDGEIEIRVGGSTVIANLSIPSGGGSSFDIMSTVVDLSASDVVTLYVNMNDGNFNVLAGETETYLNIYKIA